MNLLKKKLPGLLVIGFLGFFFYDAIHYKSNIDDSFNAATTHDLSIFESIKLMFNSINGRWFSHIITSVTFHFLEDNVISYAIYVTAMMLLFVFSISVLYRAFFKSISTINSFWFSLVFTATLYFLLFDGRQEIWAWVSSANNHLLSVTLCVFLISLLLSDKKNMVIISLLSFAIGGLNEVNAICCALAATGLFFLYRKKASSQKVLLSIIFIGISLLINTQSGGYSNRMNTLQDFTLPQAIKNTVHTFALPIMQYALIPLRVFAIISFLFFIETDFSSFQKIKTKIFMGVLFIVTVSFFLHCYILSDIAPPRGEIWAYTFVLFILTVWLKSENDSKNLTK